MPNRFYMRLMAGSFTRPTSIVQLTIDGAGRGAGGYSRIGDFVLGDGCLRAPPRVRQGTIDAI